MEYTHTFAHTFSPLKCKSPGKTNIFMNAKLVLESLGVRWWFHWGMSWWTSLYIKYYIKWNICVAHRNAKHGTGHSGIVELKHLHKRRMSLGSSFFFFFEYNGERWKFSRLNVMNVIILYTSESRNAKELVCFLCYTFHVWLIIY